MSVYVTTLVFNEAALDEAISKVVNNGKHCIVFRDCVQPLFGIVGCTQQEIRKVLQSYCDNNPRADRRKCEMIRRDHLRNPQSRSMTVVHDGIIIYCNANVDAINQKPPTPA